MYGVRWGECERRDGGSAVPVQEWIEGEEERKGDIVFRLYCFSLFRLCILCLYCAYIFYAD